MSTYKVGPGDTLIINVWQESDLTGTYTVGKDGMLTVNWLPPVKVGGLSLDEARKSLTGVIGRYIKQPIVTLSVSEYRSQRILVLGEVKNPGQYFLKNDSSLINVLLKEAGGTTSLASDTVSIVRTAESGDKATAETITVNLNKLLQGDPTQNITLQGGDTVLVPQGGGKAGTGSLGATSSNTVFVVGEVNSKGNYRIREGYTVMSAILDAGGFTKFAAQNRVKVVRGEGPAKKEFVIKMKDVMNDGDRSKDMALLPGDLVIVPRSLL